MWILTIKNVDLTINRLDLTIDNWDLSHPWGFCQEIFGLIVDSWQVGSRGKNTRVSLSQVMFLVDMSDGDTKTSLGRGTPVGW